MEWSWCYQHKRIVFVSMLLLFILFNLTTYYLSESYVKQRVNQLSHVQQQQSIFLQSLRKQQYSPEKLQALRQQQQQIAYQLYGDKHQTLMAKINRIMLANSVQLDKIQHTLQDNAEFYTMQVTGQYAQLVKVVQQLSSVAPMTYFSQLNIEANKTSDHLTLSGVLYVLQP